MLNVELLMIEIIDIDILRYIHFHRFEALDGLLYVISYSATFVSIGILLTLLGLSFKENFRHLRAIFYRMLAVLLVAAAVSLTLKTIITRERPFITYPEIEKLSEAGSSSFPSGHTLEAFAIAVAFSMLVPMRKYFMPVYIWAILVAYSRMALGVHYPSDVLAGLITGSLIGWIIPFIFKIKNQTP
jgi:undecaprenyl-diphosphatase